MRPFLIIHLVVFCVCLLIPQMAAAATVTVTFSGTVTSSTDAMYQDVTGAYLGTVVGPIDVGQTYSMSFTYDPIILTPDPSVGFVYGPSPGAMSDKFTGPLLLGSSINTQYISISKGAISFGFGKDDCCSATVRRQAI